MTAFSFMSNVSAEKIFRRDDGQLTNVSILVLAVLLLLVTADMELSQMAFALVGALAFAALQSFHDTATGERPSKFGPGSHAAAPATALHFGRSGWGRSQSRVATPAVAHSNKVHQVPCRGAGQVRNAPKAAGPGPANCFRQPSSQPIAAPSFVATGWEAEVAELLTQISPTPEGDRVVQQLAGLVRQTLQSLVPEVEVVGFASGDLGRGTAFGVAVPEVDIVVSASPQVLAKRLQNRLPSAPETRASQLDARKLQKSAIRTFTDRLVSTGGFKFRRSAFRGAEPKVTLLTPSSLGIYSEAIPIDFSVNSCTPLYNAALLTECGQIEPRARDLLLLVRRWAKDRGICHAAKGHLSPYAWSLMAIFFLQTNAREDEGGAPLLPALEGFAFSSGLLPQTTTARSEPAAAWKPPPVPSGGPKSVARLFQDFLHFYACDFNWRTEAVCPRLGTRGQPGLSLPLHIIVREDGGASVVGPCVEDPFDVTRNLGDCVTMASLERLHEELTRADSLCSPGSECSLSTLLEPWVPPERDEKEPTEDQ